MISNYNQIPMLLKLKKHIVSTNKTKETDSYMISNFKFHKFHSFLKQNTLSKKKYILVIKNQNLNIKFNYNLKFDGFSVVETKEILVIHVKTQNITISTGLKFDWNLFRSIK